MDWWRILKEAKSPKAIEHKRRYETEYESSPSRKKYRRDLERERRKRGVAGKGGKDMSHTKTGKIVPEDPHTNRARSHPSVGSTLKTFLRPCNYCGVITRPGQQCKCGNMVKAPQMNLRNESAQCELCGSMMTGEEAQQSNQQFGASVCIPCIMKEQQEINQENDMMFHSEPMDIAMRLLKMPFVSGRMMSDPDEVIDQPLYSGGDASDSPLYWSKDPQEALMYSLFGSAVLNNTEPGNIHGYDKNHLPEEQDMNAFTPPPLRETIPTIFRANPPTNDEFIHLDREAHDAHRNYMSHDIPYDRLSDEEIKTLIEEYLDEWGGAGHAGFTSGQYYPPEMREKHIQRALERLENKQAGMLELPKEVEDRYGWSKTDKKSEPMEIAMRLLKEQKKLFGGQQTLDGQFTFEDPTDFAGQEQQRQAALKEQRAKQNRMLERMRHESITNKERNAEFRANQARAKQIREAQRRKNAEGLTPLPHFQQNPE